MKLRIRDNTLRLRLSQQDVDRLRRHGRVEGRTSFGPGRVFSYALEASEEGTHLEAVYEEGGITVYVPAAWVDPWAESDRVGFEGAQDVGKGITLGVLVEKDFTCLQPRKSDEDAGGYPHPSEGQAAC